MVCTCLGLVAVSVHVVQVCRVGRPASGDEEHVVGDLADPGSDVVPVHEGVDVEPLVLAVDLGLPDAVLVLVERRRQLLVVLNVLQLVAEAVQSQIVARVADRQAGEALRYLLL